jgi:hypothetical protein
MILGISWSNFCWSSLDCKRVLSSANGKVSSNSSSISLIVSLIYRLNKIGADGRPCGIPWTILRIVDLPDLEAEENAKKI